MTVRFYSSVAAETTLQNTATPSATTIVVVATTGFPALTPFTLALDFEGATEELVNVTAVAGTSLTVDRAIDGTSATTHNAGARVRHVSSARDFADSRAHENASANIHGLGAGSALVGTLETQTLSNKTLASPVINTPNISGGQSNGTISGSATYTGLRIFSNEIQHSNLYRGTRATTTDSQWETRVTGDANARFFVRADGAHRWGPGTTLADTTFERTGNRQLRSDGAIRVERSSENDPIIQGRKTGDANDRLILFPGTIQFGDGTASPDVSLFRDSTGTLFTFARTSSASFPDDGWTSWIPTWTTTSGTATPSYGNATINAKYKVYGKTLYYSIAITFGSTTNFGGGGLTDNWLFGLPPGLTAQADWVATQMISGNGRLTQNSNNTSPCVARTFTSTAWVVDTSGGKQDGNALTNSGTIDALTPWTWASGNLIHFAGTVELA